MRYDATHVRGNVGPDLDAFPRGFVDVDGEQTASPLAAVVTHEHDVLVNQQMVWEAHRPLALGGRTDLMRVPLRLASMSKVDVGGFEHSHSRCIGGDRELCVISLDARG